MEMKNMEVTHTLRLYDPEFIAKLGGLMEQEKKHYRNRNEFLTEIVKLGYIKYLERDCDRAREKAARESGNDDTLSDDSPDQNTDGYKTLLRLSECIMTQLKNLYVNQKIMHKLLSAVYNLMLKSADNELLEEKAEEGFFDDLPARFENIVVNLKARYGL